MHMSRTTLTTSGAKFATGLRRRKTATTLDTNVRIILRNRFVLCVARYIGIFLAARRCRPGRQESSD